MKHNVKVLFYCLGILIIFFGAALVNSALFFPLLIMLAGIELHIWIAADRWWED